MICEFKFIGVISDKDLYVLKNTGEPHEYRSVWDILRYDPDKQLCSKIGSIDPKKNSELNSAVHDILKYRVESGDPLVLCICTPQEYLDTFIGRMEELNKE